MPGTRLRSVTLPSVSTSCPNPISWSREKRPPSIVSVFRDQSMRWIDPCKTSTSRQSWRSGLTTSSGESADPATSASMGWKIMTLLSAINATRFPLAGPSSRPSVLAQ